MDARPRLPHAHSSPSTVPAVRDSKKRSRGPKQASNRPTTVAGPCSRPIHRSFRPEDLLEDEPLDYALSEEGDMTTENFGFINLADQMSGVDFMPPSEVPPREGLYSTPLSWEKPQPGLRLDSLLSMQNPQQLNEDEQRRLIAIAMNTGPVLGGLGSDQYGQSSGSRGYVPGGGLHATLGSGVNLAALAAFGGGFGGFGGFGGLGEALGMSQITDDAPLLRPESPAVAQSSERPRASRSSTARSTGKGRAKEKGKQNHDDDDEEEDDNDGKESKVKSKSGDRTAHNDIERKYRTNLKDKIAELRNAVPALRTVQEGMVDEADDNAPGKGPKVSKVSVMSLLARPHGRDKESPCANINCRVLSSPRRPSTSTNWRNRTKPFWPNTSNSRAGSRHLSSFSARRRCRHSRCPTTAERYLILEHFVELSWYWMP